MAAVKFQKQSEEWLMFRDFWELCQKFWIPEDDDSYWDLLLSESDKFYKKYQNVHLANEIAITFVESQGKRLKEMKRK